MGSADPNIGSIGAAAGIPSLNVADIPANIRNGNAAAQRAYGEGLAFERVLVNELSQQMASTMFGGGGGMSGAAAAYSSLIPQTLSSSIMSGGGLGLAEEFAQDVDPSLRGGGSG